MNRKQLTIILVIGVAIAVAGLFMMKKEAASWQSSSQNAGRKLLGEFPLNDVASIHIKSPTNELTLARKSDQWTVKERWDYPANFSEISTLVGKLAELKVVQSMEVGPSQMPRLQLIPPDKGTNGGTMIELADASGKPLKSVLLGKPHMKQSPEDGPMGGGGWPDGRYVLVTGDKDVAVISDPLSNAEAKPETWINKDFFKVEKLKSIEVIHPESTNSFKLFRETENGELKLADAKPEEHLDASKASPLGSMFSFPSFNDVVDPGAKPETTGMDKPLIAKIETFDNFTYAFKIGGKTNDENLNLSFTVTANIPTERKAGADEKKEDKEKLDKEFKDKADKLKEKLGKEKALEKWTYQVSKWTAEQLFKDRGQLLAEKKDEAKPADSTPAPAPPAAAHEEPPVPLK